MSKDFVSRPPDTPGSEVPDSVFEGAPDKKCGLPDRVSLERSVSCLAPGQNLTPLFIPEPQELLSPLESNKKSPFLIGVAGGTASGKSTVCEKIMEKLGSGSDQVMILSQESFYRELTVHEIARARQGMFNFDHPNAFDNELMESCLKDIMAGRPTRVPVYDFRTNSRVPSTFTTIYPSDVILLEGILVFYFPNVREMFDMKLFVDTDADSRLAKRVLKDTEELGRTLDQVLHQYTSFVKPAFEEFCIPTKKFADVIIPRGADNTVAIDLIVQHITAILSAPRETAIQRQRSKGGRSQVMREEGALRRRHQSDTSNIYNAKNRRDLQDVLNRPH